MPSPNSSQNGAVLHLISVRAEPAGQFTAQVVGLEELKFTAPSREEAVQGVRQLVSERISSGQLVPLEVPTANLLLAFSGHLNPDDELEKEFVDETARMHQEDLEQTLREDDQECSNSSSTPAT